MCLFGEHSIEILETHLHCKNCTHSRTNREIPEKPETAE